MTDNNTTQTTKEIEGVKVEPLAAYIERIERLEEEKRGIAEDIKEIYVTAKGNGYDPKIMRAIIKLRKMNKSDRAEADALLDIYRRALGLAE